jgi:hypothetical protein
LGSSASDNSIEALINMKTPVRFAATLAAALLISGTSLFAVPAFSVANGGIAIGSQNTATAATSAGTAWTVDEGMTATGTLALTDTDGNPLVSFTGITGHTAGAWITKTVTNNTLDTWTSFEMELQQILGTPSGEGDGLSFAQGSGLVFSSSVFTTITQQEITRDYLNFSGGSVLPGQSVSFTFAITDNSPQSPVYLLQTPNKREQGVPDAGATALLLGLSIAGLLGLRRRLS